MSSLKVIFVSLEFIHFPLLNCLTGWALMIFGLSSFSFLRVSSSHFRLIIPLGFELSLDLDLPSSDILILYFPNVNPRALLRNVFFLFLV